MKRAKVSFPLEIPAAYPELMASAWSLLWLGRSVRMIERLERQIVELVTMIKTTRKLKTTALKTETAKVAPLTAAPAKKTAPKSARVSLEYVKPDAKQVCVAGTFNQWKPEAAPLAPAGNGRWVGDLAINPGRYEYLFVVDGQWLPDPNAKEAVQNPYGGKNSVLTVSE